MSAPQFSSDAAELASMLRRFLSETEPYEGHSRRGPSDDVVLDRIRAVAGLGLDDVLLNGDASSAQAEMIAAIFYAVGSHPTTSPLTDMVVTAPVALAGRPDLAKGRLVVAATASEAELGNVTDGPWGGVHIKGDRCSGPKTLVRAGRFADAYVVSAMSDDEPSIVVVDSDSDVVRTEALESPDRLARLTTVEFDNASCEVVAKGAGAVTIVETLAIYERLAAVAEWAGLVEAATAQTVEYANVRHQFGRPIGSFQAVKQLLAEGRFEQHAITAVMLRAWRAVAAAEDLRDARHALDQAHLYAAGASMRAMDVALQVHGGIGYTLECPLSWYYLRSDTLRCDAPVGFRLAREVGLRVIAEAADRRLEEVQE